jgi:hypothetical protein
VLDYRVSVTAFENQHVRRHGLNGINSPFIAVAAGDKHFDGLPLGEAVVKTRHFVPQVFEERVWLIRHDVHPLSWGMGGSPPPWLVRPPHEVVERHVEVVGELAESIEAGKVFAFLEKAYSLIAYANSIPHLLQREVSFASQHHESIGKFFRVTHSNRLLTSK